MILNATETRSLFARKARLDAEFGGATEIKFPAALEKSADQEPVARLMQQERAVLEARRNAYDNQLAGLKQLKQFLDKETVSLKGQLATHNTVVGLARKELETISGLVQKGLAVQSRKMGLERNVAQVEGDRLRMETTLAHNQQEISRTSLAIIDLNARRDIELATEMRNTQARLDELGPRLETSKLLLDESEQAAPMMMAIRIQGKLEPVYAIVRQVSRSSPAVELQADEMTAVQPGDTIKVKNQTEFNAGATATSFSRWSNGQNRDGAGMAIGGVPNTPVPDRKSRAPAQQKPISHQFLK